MKMIYILEQKVNNYKYVAEFLTVGEAVETLNILMQAAYKSGVDNLPCWQIQEIVVPDNYRITNTFRNV